MGWGIEDERTRAEKIAPPTDKVREDVSLLVISGPDVGKRVLVKPPGGVIGRQPDCAIQIRDTNISRRHALIEFSKNGQVMLTDLGSKNGVYINGARISRAEIYDGNNVQVSNDTVMRVRFQDPAETELLDELQGATVLDQLTRLPNRRYLLDRLGQEMSFARRHEEPVAVVMLDIDDFAKVNETDGQAGGDAMLRSMAKLVRKNARAEDVVARYGADQMVVLMRRTTLDQAALFGERICEAVRKATFDVGDVPIRASVSIGVASFEPGHLDIDDNQQLLDGADTAMFEAKSGGKDRVAVWSRTPPVEAESAADEPEGG